MSNAKELLDKILHDEKLLGSKAFRDKIYSDVPIIRTAAQLVRPETPARIKAMKALALTPEAYWKTSAWLFITQGKFMADYTDDFVYEGSFTQYYPTYRELTTEQLRGYFTWRAAVRKGNINDSPLPYHFIYVYELLNGIGTEHGMDNFRRIDDFCRNCSKFNEKLMSYREKWLFDYAIYNDLDASALSNIGDSENEKNIITLIHWDEHNEDDIYNAISALSTHKCENSKFAQDNEDAFRKVLCRSFVLMSEFFRDHRKSPFWSKLFGKMSDTAYRLFDTAVFYDAAPAKDREYIVNEIHSFIFRNGRWTCRKLTGCRHRSAKLGEFAKSVDSVMREEYSYPHKLSSTDVSKQTKSIIMQAIAEFRSAQKKAEAMKIEIDISKLSAIRKAADITREKLLVDDDEPAITAEPEPIITEEAAPVTNDGDCPLSDAETAFVKTLLSGGDYDAEARKFGCMTSILADSVNEKLFDDFGDTVILFEDDVPCIIEDYIDELKEIVHLKEN
ncbi:MAG: TerB N-terminal domain-containing protein [Ruminococcus sp.]|nr:TerB N-terminal domain-containing protein [Ruminococcus sp.]